MDLDAILVRSPVNRTAYSVVRQGGCSEDTPLRREELVAINDRLERKLRLLRSVLRIKTKAQHVNLVYKMSKGLPTMRGKAEPRIVVEYRRVGIEMQRMQARLAELRKERRAAAEAEHAALRAPKAPQLEGQPMHDGRET